MDTAAAEPETLTLEDATGLLGSQLMEEMPEAQPEVAAAEQQETPQKSKAAPPAAASAAGASTAAPTDSLGNLFDPLVHEANADGSPVFRKDGRTLKRRRVPLTEFRETSTMGTLPEADPAPGDPAAQLEAEPADAEKDRAKIEATATTITGLQLMVMRMALGDECGKEEAMRVGLIDAWSETLRHYGMSTMHPMMGVAMVTGLIVYKAVHEPKNESNVTKLRHWFQRKGLGLWQWITGRRAARTDAAAAQPAAAGA